MKAFILLVTEYNTLNIAFIPTMTFDDPISLKAKL